MLGNLGKKALRNVTTPLARDNLPGLVSNLASNAINKFEIKISGKGFVRAGKRWWSYWNNKTWNNKKQDGRFLRALLALLAASLVQPMISSVVKSI